MQLSVSCFMLAILCLTVSANANSDFISIHHAIHSAKSGDTIFVPSGIYQEGNIRIDKPIVLIANGKCIIDGCFTEEVITITSSHVTIIGFTIMNSTIATLEDPCAVRIIKSRDVRIDNNTLLNNFFGIYVQECSNCYILNNTIRASGRDEIQIGNGIHCWKSDSLLILNNSVNGHRDGIYFEFVTNSEIAQNISSNNIRYGLHFMFSNNDHYSDNMFHNNGSGVAVMYTKGVTMECNTFQNNWGNASYGLLLKDISDSKIQFNTFDKNTTAIYMEGTSRIQVYQNTFSNSGWGFKIQASCMDVTVLENNFIANTFDISTNGSLVLNHFANNYWDKYHGYDINKDNIGDIPYHPLSLFSYIIEQNPPSIILFRSIMMSLLEKSEKLIPSLTPDQFIDLKPQMREHK